MSPNRSSVSIRDTDSTVTYTPEVADALRECWHAFLDEQETDPAFQEEKYHPSNLEDPALNGELDAFDKAWVRLVALVGERDAERLWAIDRAGDDDPILVALATAMVSRDNRLPT
jgi:hypothetical protein